MQLFIKERVKHIAMQLFIKERVKHIVTIFSSYK